MLFKDIPGLSSVKSDLIQAVHADHVAHARLFAGPAGMLGLPLALANATYIHCENKGKDDACGICPACVKSLKYIHPDTHFVFPVANLKGDKDEEAFRSDMLKSWRSFLLEQPFGQPDDWVAYHGGEDKQAIITRNESRSIIRALSLKPFESRHKVMIIWQPEWMHPSAANGILKILEEPAEQTYFILVTYDADKLLPTILSRTQIINIPMLNEEEVTDYLASKNGVTKSQAKHFARLAGGNLAEAIAFSENEENDHAALFAEWMRLCYKKRFDKIVPMAEDFHAMDRLSQKNLMLYSLDILRECLLHGAEAGTLQRAQDEEMKFINDFSKVMQFDQIERATQLIDEASFHLERNGSAKMIFLDLSIKIAGALEASPPLRTSGE